MAVPGSEPSPQITLVHGRFLSHFQEGEGFVFLTSQVPSGTGRFFLCSQPVLQPPERECSLDC